MNDKTLKTWGIVFVGIVLIASSGYFVGFQAGLKQTRNIEVESVINIDNPEEVTANFGIFWEAWSKLKTKHIDSDKIEEQDLLYGAIEGLASAFEDQHTVFFKPEDSKKFAEDISGSFSGIGAEIGTRDGKLIVISPLKNSPAERAGLLPGDEIQKIDGESSIGFSAEEGAKIIRGDLGTTVTLGIFREDWGEQRDIDIVRENINIPTVEWNRIDGDIIHLQIFTFNGNTPFAFQEAVIESVLGGGNGMILDLRSNPGGLLDVAINIAGWFLDRGEVVVTERFTSGDEKIFRARGNESLKNFPVVILINEGSASASEILAGAIAIQNGVKIVGEQSFGKGTVQELEELSDGSTIKITIANWLLPDGTLIEGNGIIPDVRIPITEEDIEAERDSQLERAIELLRIEMEK